MEINSCQHCAKRKNLKEKKKFLANAIKPNLEAEKQEHQASV